MKITRAVELQAKFLAKLQIVGENAEGELEFMGTDQQWRAAEKFETLICISENI